MSEVFALPREIVVAKYHSPRFERLIEHVTSDDIERQRGDVLDDDQINTLEHFGELSERRRRGRRRRQSRDHDVDGSFAGDLNDFVSERKKCVFPFLRFDGNPVSPTEAKADESESGHSLRLGALSGISEPSSRVFGSADSASAPFSGGLAWPSGLSLPALLVRTVRTSPSCCSPRGTRSSGSCGAVRPSI